MDISGPSIAEKAKKEVQVYRSFPAVLSSVDPILWWHKRDQIAMLPNYPCFKPSSVPSERVLSSAEDPVSVEQAWLLPKRADFVDLSQKELLE